MSVAIPNGIDDVTAEWLAAATGWSIDSMAIEQIGVGVGVSSALYRVNLTGKGCPSSVIVKLPALDEAAVFTSTMLRMYVREVEFFKTFAADSPIRVPELYFGAVDEETSKFVLVMEDFKELRSVDQVSGMEVTDAERTVDALAQWHATWWGKADALAEAGITMSLADPIYHAVLPVIFAEGWEKLTTELDLPESILGVGPRWVDALPGMLTRLAAAPTAMLHGDYRADNIFFADDGSLALLDFQIIGTGTAAYDLAYFVTQSLEADVAADQERVLFDRWVAALHAAGVPADQTGRLWEDYRLAALFCLVYPVVASRGMDLTDPRQRALLETMSARLGRAIDHLELAQLI